MKTQIVVLGAGFGGLELATLLSEGLGESADMTLIDENDAFVFGFSKLDVMFGRKTPDAVGDTPGLKGGDLVEKMAAMNMEFLALQTATQTESRKFTALSNASRARHDIALNAIRTIK